MTADRNKTGPEPGKTQPGSASPSGPPAASKASGGADEISKQTMADLSRRLSERAAQQRAVDPRAAAAERRAALEAYDHARERRLIVGLSVAVAAALGAGIVYLASTVGSPPVRSVPIVAAPEPASLKSASAASAPAPPDAPSPSPSVADTPAVEAAAAPAAPAADSQPAPVEAANQAPLRRDEVKEIQARLRSFGFNPGPVDGVPGPATEDAVMHYQRHRGQLQTGTVDSQLLEQLRQDPAPQLAQRAARSDARTARSPAPRRSDPFEPVRAAGDRLGRWLDSLAR
jgi:Putative peptidoglycan binding domain